MKYSDNYLVEINQLIAEMDRLVESLKSSDILENEHLSNTHLDRITEIQGKIGELKLKRAFEKSLFKPKAA
ncbi:MAG: hypothetical protein AAF519_07715 [Bacteroidota bacterium]